MKISEIEIRTGMERTNIRFYEREGLINPLRQENGYREFTEDDLETLLRIKLLRSIHVPLSEIKALMDGEISLMEILDHQIDVLENEKGDIGFAQNLCLVMKEEEASLYHLNAKKYLNQLEEKALETGTKYFSMEKDILPQVFNPWRRFFARSLDFSIYGIIISAIQVLFFHSMIANQSTAAIVTDTVLVLALMLFMEPVLLSNFGTTLGKAIFGLRVESHEGKKLSYYDAFYRTYGVIRYGLGFQIPIYSTVTHVKSYHICKEGGTLPWDEYVSYTIKDKKLYRSVVFVGVSGLLFSIALMLILVERIPPNRGELTVAEFAENYKYYQEYLEMDLGKYELNEFGEWVEIEIKLSDNYIDHVDTLYQEKPIFWYELSGDKITGISYHVAIENIDEPILSYENQMLLTYLALVGAQDEVTIFSSSLSEVAKVVSAHSITGFSFEKHGLQMAWDIVYEGYVDIGNMFYYDRAEKEHRYEVSYSVTIPKEIP